jgi:translation elongation factor EF-Tu-like GTPase
VASVRGRGTTVAGTVEHAPLRIGQEVAILRDAGFLLTMVRGIYRPGEPGHPLDEAAPGAAVGVIPPTRWPRAT